MSTYFDILTAVQTAAAAVVSNAVIRRKLYRLESDVFPMVYVVPEVVPGESVQFSTFARHVVYQYPVNVVYAAAGAADLTTGLSTFLAKREAIRNALYVPLLSGVTAVFDTNFNPDPTLRFAELLGGDYDVCGWRFFYSAKEVRTT